MAMDGCLALCCNALVPRMERSRNFELTFALPDCYAHTHHDIYLYIYISGCFSIRCVFISRQITQTMDDMNVARLTTMMQGIAEEIVHRISLENYHLQALDDNIAKCLQAAQTEKCLWKSIYTLKQEACDCGNTLIKSQIDSGMTCTLEAAKDQTHAQQALLDVETLIGQTYEKLELYRCDRTHYQNMIAEAGVQAHESSLKVQIMQDEVTNSLKAKLDIQQAQRRF